MKNINSFRHICKNKWLLLSGSAAICLFGVSPSRYIAGIGICTLAALLFWGATRKIEIPKKRRRLPIVLVGIMCDFTLISKFIQDWTPSRKVAAMAEILHLSTQRFLLVLGLLGGLVAFNFLCFILLSVIMKIHKTFKDSFETDIHICLKNIKSNWYISFSALAFFCLESQAYLAYYIGVILAFLCIVLVTSQKYRIIFTFRDEPWIIKMYAALSAMGMCLAGKRAFCRSLASSKKVALIPNGFTILYLLSIIGAVAGLIFTYLFIISILCYVKRIICKTGIVKRISYVERFIYVVTFIGFVVLALTAFLESQAFYGTKYSYDVIYTSDSPALVKNTADLYLSYGENDLRQPLFAVFAAPFTGSMYLIASLISKVFHISDGLFYSMENMIQIALMLVATILLVDMMELKKGLRICFFVVLCSSYTMLLSSLMMEQYIVAYFWLVFALYSVKTADKQDTIAYYGATGTLLTSGIIFPIFCFKKENDSWKEYFLSLFETGFKVMIKFLLLMVAFSRFDVIYNLTTKINQLSRFTGASISSLNKLHQYISFISNCFIAPNASVDTTKYDHVSWQLHSLDNINVLGVIVLALSMCSLIIGRKDSIVRIAGSWAIFSLLILFVLGWGTVENGLILYSLYFCWAYYVLLFKLVDTFNRKIKMQYLTYIVSLFCFGIMLYLNIPRMQDMISFAIDYYPA